MIFALVVLVGGYWLARALQGDRKARAIFDDRAPYKRYFLATLMALTITIGLVFEERSFGSGVALAWLFAIVAWVVSLRWFLDRLPSAFSPDGRTLAPAPSQPSPPSQPGRRPHPSAESGREADEIYRRAMARPDPSPAVERPSPRVSVTTSNARRPVYPAQPDPALYRLHCKRCGSVLTRPMREYHPRDARRGNFRTGRMIAPGSTTRPSQADVLPGDADGAWFFAQALLDQAAIPLTWNTNSEGCCGPEARGGPNVLCHGCGAWALFYNETCYSPRFFAGRPEEVELRECEPAERFTRQAPEHGKEHWRKVALEQPGVIEVADVMQRVTALYLPRFAAAGKALDIRSMRGGAARIDAAAFFEVVCLLLEHALEVSVNVRLDSNVGGRGVMTRVLCSAPVAADAEETVPSKAAACARTLGGRLHASSFPDGEFQMVLDIPCEPIPLKAVDG